MDASKRYTLVAFDPLGPGEFQLLRVGELRSRPDDWSDLIQTWEFLTADELAKEWEEVK